MVEVLVDGLSKEEWSQEASAFIDHSLYQSWEYAEQRAATEGSRVSRIVVRFNGATIGMAQCRIKKVPLMGLGIAHVHWGPLWRRVDASTEDIENTLLGICQEYAGRQGLLVRLVPHVFRGAEGEVFVRRSTAVGLRRNAQAKPYRTFLLNLSSPLEDLRRAMARRWKRALKRPEARGIRIIAGQEDDLFAQFLPLYDEMHQRKGFDSAVNPHVFREIHRRAVPAEKMLILLALWEDRPVAGLISSHLGDTCLGLLGASDEAGRRYQAAYVLHWENIQRAKAAGMRWYDLGGIDRESNPDGYLFKVGLGRTECELLGEFEVCQSRVCEAAVWAAEKTYRWLKAIRFT